MASIANCSFTKGHTQSHLVHHFPHSKTAIHRRDSTSPPDGLLDLLGRYSICRAPIKSQFVIQFISFCPKSGEPDSCLPVLPFGVCSIFRLMHLSCTPWSLLHYVLLIWWSIFSTIAILVKNKLYRTPVSSSIHMVHIRSSLPLTIDIQTHWIQYKLTHKDSLPFACGWLG